MTEPKPQVKFEADFLSALFRDPLEPGYAQAAHNRREHGPLPSWQRRLRRGGLVAALLVIGALMAIAYKQVAAATPEREKVRAGLISEIKKRDTSTETMFKTADELQREVSKLRESALNTSEIASLHELEAATGVRRVSGDGGVIVLSDGPNATNDRFSRVGDFDLQQTANALWAAGAEAIAINGQRLTSISAIRKAGLSLMIDTAPIRSPYRIVAIGPGNMIDQYEKSSIAALHRQYHEDPTIKIGYDVDEESDLQIEAAVMPKLYYATVPSVSPSPSANPSPSGSPKGPK